MRFRRGQYQVPEMRAVDRFGRRVSAGSELEGDRLGRLTRRTFYRSLIRCTTMHSVPRQALPYCLCLFFRLAIYNLG